VPWRGRKENRFCKTRAWDGDMPSRRLPFNGHQPPGSKRRDHRHAISVADWQPLAFFRRNCVVGRNSTAFAAGPTTSRDPPVWLPFSAPALVPPVYKSAPSPG
jgi:hypothetical protein